MHGMGFNPEKNFCRCFQNRCYFAIYGCLEVMNDDMHQKKAR